MTKKKVRDSLEDQFIVVCVVGNFYLVCGPQLRSFCIKEMLGFLGEILSKFPQNPK